MNTGSVLPPKVSRTQNRKNSPVKLHPLPNRDNTTDTPTDSMTDFLDLTNSLNQSTRFSSKSSIKEACLDAQDSSKVDNSSLTVDEVNSSKPFTRKTKLNHGKAVTLDNDDTDFPPFSKRLEPEYSPRLITATEDITRAENAGKGRGDTGAHVSSPIQENLATTSGHTAALPLGARIFVPLSVGSAEVYALVDPGATKSCLRNLPESWRTEFFFFFIMKEN